MSATNRGRERLKDDYYKTPEWCTKVLLKHELIEKDVLEPSCGEGAISNILKSLSDKINITTIDINPEFKPDIITNYLNWSADKYYNTIITNPPFKLAMEFILKSMLHADKIIMLLRISFLGSNKRLNFWRNNPYSRMYIITPRPSFAHGGTDSAEYVWFVWDKNSKKDQKTLHISKYDINK